MAISPDDGIRKDACEKANKLKEKSAADFCSFGEWVSSVVLDEFANGENVTESQDVPGAYDVRVTFQVGKAASEPSTDCTELFALRTALATDCIDVIIKGRKVTIC
jgi:hypothetical protein